MKQSNNVNVFHYNLQIRKGFKSFRVGRFRHLPKSFSTMPWSEYPVIN